MPEQLDTENVRMWATLIGAGILIAALLLWLGWFIWQGQFFGDNDINSAEEKLGVLETLRENSTIVISAEEKYKILEGLSASRAR